MPPKQKQVKKGPSYKPSLPLKDLLPAQIKQLPRQPKPLKIPESFPEPPKNNETMAPIFDQWPSEEIVKAHDFGINSQAAFVDSFHQHIDKYFNSKVSEWKRMNEVENDGNLDQENDESQPQQNKQKSKNQIESLKNIKHSNGQIQKKEEICVIETYMRPQTESQMQARMKQQAEKAEKAAKDKKKAAKKQQPKEQGPIQVSDVKMSDILTRHYLNDYSIWIGSQLQLIKQRNLVDINNNEAIWKKIYPQQNGVPKITKSGKYWVKLLYMGKYIKIEVDDRIPLNQFHQELFPLSEKLNQKWTLIITKALVKYLSKALNDNVIGSSLIIYALTGMISQNITLNHYKEWQKLQELVNDSHYEKKDIVVSCFSSNKNKSFKRVTKVKLEKDSIVEDNDQEQQQYIEKQINTKILNGYAYCIGDYFQNKNIFNMVFSQEKSQKEMLLKNQFNELCKVTISNKSREEKLEFRRKKKELKQKLGIQEKKRLQLIAKDPIRYHFLKLLSSSLKIQCQYGEKEIQLAKKCILNKLSQPPNYDIPIQKQEKDVKSMQSLSGVKFKDETELFPNIHDFSLLPNVQQVFERKDTGTWIKDQDLLDFFQYMQVIYNPNYFSNKKIELIESKKANTFTNDESKQILVIQKVEQQQQKQLKVRVMLGFAYQKSAYDLFKPYTRLQKFDFDSFRSTSNIGTLNTDISSKLLELKNQNTVFRLNTMSKGNYNYWISSNSPFKLLSISDYLSEYEGYTKKNLTFQYPAIEASTYFPLNKIKIKHQGSQSNTIILKASNIKQQLLNNINYRLVCIPKEQSSLTTEQIQGIITKNAQKVLLSYEYTRFVVNASCEYYLIVEAHSKDNIPDGSLELQLLYKEQGLVIEQLQQVEPIKFMEKYIPNKYGLICKERIFTNSDNNTTFSFKIAQFQEIQGGGGGKAAKKGGKEEPTTELIQKPFGDSKNIILKILNGDDILYESSGINSVTIPNFKFLSTKANPNKQYYLCANFNLRQWPQASVKNEKTQKICWVTQIMSQQSLAFVRDTKQEEKERLTKKSWEDSEPSRAERAKKARRRFLIELKKQKGQQLTEQQEQILNAPRLTKKQQMQQDKKNEDKKGAKGAKKEDKKAGKDAKKQQVIQEKPVERIPPKSKQNFTNEIKQYLKILQNCTVKYVQSDENSSKIRSQEQLKSIKDGAIMSIQNRVGKLIRNIEKRQTVKIKEKQKKQSLSIFFNESKIQFKQKYNGYIQWKNQDTEKDKVKQDKEKFLIDVINQEKPTIAQAQLKKNINQYKEINGHNAYLVDVAYMLRKNIRINALTEKISSLIPAWQVEELKNINEEIKNDKIEGIDEQVFKQMKDLLEEVEKNPNIVAEKQAEAKKGKKGGKK